MGSPSAREHARSDTDKMIRATERDFTMRTQALSALRRLTRHAAAACLAAASFATPAAANFDTIAEAAYVMDLNTGATLLDKNADEPRPPASMSKLITLNMLFEAIEAGQIALDDSFSVSSRARNMGGSRMFLDEGDRPTVEELIRGIAVLSGNDATVTVAEGLAGSEAHFATQATQRARELGLENTTIANASGWPHPDHRMSMRDLAILSARLIEEFPQYYGYLSEPEWSYGGITQPNRLPLLDEGVGLDGLKTGFTSEAGYALAGSAEQGDRRIVFVIGGLESEQERVEEAERIINWAFRQFRERTLVEPGTRLGSADVWMGQADSVGLVVEDRVHALLPIRVQDAIAAELRHEGPVEAPVAAGARIGELVIEIPDMETLRVPLVAEHAVERGGFVVRLRTAAELLTRRLMREAADL